MKIFRFVIITLLIASYYEVFGQVILVDPYHENMIEQEFHIVRYPKTLRTRFITMFFGADSNKTSIKYYNFNFIYNGKITRPDSIDSGYNMEFYDYINKKFTKVSEDKYLSENLYFDSLINKWALRKINYDYFYQDTLRLMPYYDLKVYYGKYYYEVGLYSRSYWIMPMLLNFVVSSNFLHDDKSHRALRRWWEPFKKVYWIERSESTIVQYAVKIKKE